MMLMFDDVVFLEKNMWDKNSDIPLDHFHATDVIDDVVLMLFDDV